MTSPDTAPDFRIEFRSNAFDTRDALAALDAFLAKARVAADERGTIELAMAEVCNNVVEHAYPDGSAGQIRLSCRNGGRGVEIELRDDGAPMPDGRVPVGSPPDLGVAEEDLPEGGFGWFLIRELVREISYARQDGQNVLRLHFDLNTDR